MADFERREEVTRHVEYVLPTGTPIGEFAKAYGAARVDYANRHGLAADRLPDDWATVHARDDEVIIRFEVKEGGRG